MKLPGTYACYAVLMAAFGQTPEGIHIGLALVNAVTSVLVLVLGHRLFGPVAGAAACATHAFLSLSPDVLGLQGHATHFVTLFAVAGSVVLLAARDSGRLRDWFASGVLFGLAFLMKQHGVFFTALGLACALAWGPRRAGPARAAVLGAGAALPFAATCAAFAIAGGFERFWFWTFTYAREYVTQNDPSRAWTLLRAAVPDAVGYNWLLYFVAAAGCVAAWREPGWRGPARFVTGMGAVSFLAACPGLYFRNHYFIPMLPAVSLFAGAAIGWVEQVRTRRGSVPEFLPLVPWVAAPLALALSLQPRWELFTELSPVAACRAVYGAHPFPEALRAADLVRERTAPDDRIAVVGSEPEIYFYARRRSAVGLMYLYPLWEDHPHAERMRQEFVSQIEAARPAVLVVVESGPYESQGRAAGADTRRLEGRAHGFLCRPVGMAPLPVADRVRDYCRAHYDLAAEIVPEGCSVDASLLVVRVYQRRP